MSANLSTFQKRGLKEPTTKPFMAFLRGSRSSSVTLAFYMQMISLNDCGTVMKVACAMQLPLAESLQREALDGSMILPVALDVAIPQSMDVVQRQVRLPPFIVYKGKHLYTTWTKGGADKGRYAVSESGWMEKANYESWFITMFLPAVKHLTESRPVVLFFDGHHSHISVNLIEMSQARNVHLMLLPANTTHVLQPLDVGVYGPLKQAWKSRILPQYKRKKPEQPI